MQADVVVVGAGPVGQTTALLLARWGVSCIVVDERAQREPGGSRAICQQRDVLDVWDAVGAGEQIAAEGTTWSRARTYFRDQELFCVNYADEGRGRFPAWVNLSQSRTEAILDERVAAQPLVMRRWGHRAITLVQDAAGVQVTCETASARVEISAAYAVVCSGARDRLLHEQLGVELRGRTFEDQFVISDLHVQMPEWRNERRFYFDPPWNPGRQVLIHSCPDQTFRIDWQVPVDLDLRAEIADGRHDRRIRAIVGDRPYRALFQSSYRFHSRHVERMRVGRVLIAGDAAHLVSPFGARGLNSGVQDAENAAWKLAFVIRGWAPATLLDSYHDERLAAALENIEVTERTMRFLVPRDAPERDHRAALLERAVSDLAARREVDSGRLAEPYWYTRSALTTPDPRRAFAGRPDAGRAPAPGPGILIPEHGIDGPRGWLRRLVRDGLLLLCADDVDAARFGEALRDAVTAPSCAYRAGELDASGSLAHTFGISRNDVWLVRPDGHIAATLHAPSASGVVAATRRCLGAPA